MHVIPMPSAFSNEIHITAKKKVVIKGFYPLGRNGMWHGGVHFDAGTAGVLDQSSVHCLADGEVVAYRFDTQSPNTPFLCNALQVWNPFSRNFVLVRHRLQAPKIQDEPQHPRSLRMGS